jgi:large subunit ribosomal protein L18
MKTQKRRRNEGKTNYLVRMKLLKSEKPRVVFRKTNKHVIAQYIKSEAGQDSVIFGVTSKALIKYGWSEKFVGSLKSVPASYLTGYLAGKKVIKEEMEEPIVDLGMQRPVKKSKVFAFIKGLVDSGIKIKCDSENFPEEERLEGRSTKEDISKMVAEIKGKIDNL